MTPWKTWNLVNSMRTERTPVASRLLERPSDNYTRLLLKTPLFESLLNGDREGFMHFVVFKLCFKLPDQGASLCSTVQPLPTAAWGGSTLKPKVLIFDKDPAITQQLFWTLCDYYDVFTANDYQTAVRRAAAYEPTVAVLDLNAPASRGSDDIGSRILDYLKSRLPKTLALGMTSDSLSDSRNKYLALGVNELLEKPFDTEQLLDCLRRLTPLRSFDGLESGAFRFCY